MSQTLPNIDPEFIVIIGSAWCNERGFGVSYSWDGARFNNRNDAIKSGLRLRGSDDFNIGQTYGDDLVWFGWMDQQIDEDLETMAEIASNLGLSFNEALHGLVFPKATGKVIGRKGEHS